MTTPNYKAKALSPIIPVANIESSIRFYADVLGFDIALQSDGYSILTRDGASPSRPVIGALYAATLTGISS